jgi:chromosome segregation ATPase
MTEPTIIERTITDWRGRRITTERVIEEHEAQPRIKPQSALSAQEVAGMVDQLRQDMQDAQDRFDDKDRLDRERTQQKQSLEVRIADLQAQLNSLQEKLDRLNALGSVRQKFLDDVKTLENRVPTLANAAWKFLADKFANEKHGATFSELTKGLKEGIEFAVNRLGLRAMLSYTFCRVHRIPAGQISDAFLDQTMQRIFDATVKVEEILNQEAK